jgi:restriction system protein
MPIPDFESLMRPLLDHLADGIDHTTGETIDALARDFRLSEEELSELLPSGKQARFKNRIAWAKFYLKKAGMVESPRRGVYRISPNGLTLLHTHSGPVSIEVLEQVPEFREFLASSRRASQEEGQDLSGKKQFISASSDLTPEELLEKGFSQLTGQVAAELLEKIRQASPEFLETLVLDLLLALGYGGSRRDAGRHVGRTGDGGVDGLINEDRLGLETIYFQAKRWEGTVGRPEIQKFAGALQGQRARKGIFITTSSFTKEALEYVCNIDSKIVLIDGPELTRRMIDHGVGVTTVTSYEVKRVDSDYFVED